LKKKAHENEERDPTEGKGEEIPGVREKGTPHKYSYLHKSRKKGGKGFGVTIRVTVKEGEIKKEKQ